MPSPHPSARVAVDTDTWQAFRQAALVGGIHVSEYLAKLVRAELARRSSTLPGQVSLDATEADQGLAALKAVRAAIDELDDIAGRLARSRMTTEGHGETSPQVSGCPKRPLAVCTRCSTTDRAATASPNPAAGRPTQFARAHNVPPLPYLLSLSDRLLV